jgi:hypothetical protein
MIRFWIAVVLASLAGAAPAQSTLYRCKDASGKTSYSDRGCPGQTAGSPMKRRGKLEGDCAQGSRAACEELDQLRKQPKPAAGAANADPKKSQRDRQGAR